MSGKPKSISHGTYGGYQAHRKRDEDACEACREALREYMRQRRRGSHERAMERRNSNISDKARRALVARHLDEYAKLRAEFDATIPYPERSEAVASS